MVRADSALYSVEFGHPVPGTSSARRVIQHIVRELDRQGTVWYDQDVDEYLSMRKVSDNALPEEIQQEQDFLRDHLAAPTPVHDDHEGRKIKEALNKTVELLIEQRDAARANKDWAQADKIRNLLTGAGITIQDSPTGTTWSM